MVNITIKSLTFGYNGSMILDGLNLVIEDSEVLGLVGPNGSGKTTLIKCIDMILKPKGSILIDGRDIDTVSRTDLAKRLGYVPQSSSTPLATTVFEGDKGTAKSTAVRALADLLEDIVVAEDCPFNCNPRNAEDMCDLCFDRSQRGQIKEASRKTPVIDLPLGATEDRVVGSLNVERAIKEGIRALEPGILAAANRGILYIDEVNLLDDHVADVLLDSAAMGVNVVEREGVSVAHPSKFILVGTMNPEEGELRPQLLDRFGLQVNVVGIEDIDQRMLIAMTAERFDADPEGFSKEQQALQDDLKGKISAAREILGRVTMSDDLLRTIASTCIDLGVKTHRAEIVISRTAKTIAAFEGRTEANQEDVKKAMELALAHRMRSRPFEPPILNKDKLEKSMEKQQQDQQQQKQQQQEQQPKQPPQQKKQEQQPENPDQQEDSNQAQAASPQEQIFEIGAPIDVRQINMPRKRDKFFRRKTSGRRINTLALQNSGRYLRQRMPKEGKDIAIDATIRAAAPYQKARSGPNAIKVKSEDIREKERVRKTSAIPLFVVDGSGSMGAMQRMESAKGAVLSLLMDSYQKRDKMEISERTKQLGVHTIVIDTEVVDSSFMEMRLGYCREIAEMTGGKYYPISGLSSEALYSIVDGEQKLLLEANT
ncbi:ATP-binding cassette domain-containing protein [Methanothrix sp.]|uniref:ATP-binding cassette domain-containing protein n=1 Tax=Methanothrix sp. TaxID=90426 RepID=UPI003299C582